MQNFLTNKEISHEINYIMVKSYTSKKQSEMLIKLGIPIESADMVYFGIHQGMDGKYHLSGTNTEDDVVPIYKNLCIKVFEKTTASDVINQLPCWSLAALRACLPPGISIDGILYVFESHNTFDNAWVYEYKFEDISAPLYSKSKNEIDAAVNMIIQLKENKMI